jgi:hypothetical protein
LVGLAPGTETLAHAGGFLGGILLGAALPLFPARALQPLINLLSGSLFAVLVIWPWWLALTHTN